MSPILPLSQLNLSYSILTQVVTQAHLLLHGNRRDLSRSSCLTFTNTPSSSTTRVPKRIYLGDNLLQGSARHSPHSRIGRKRVDLCLVGLLRIFGESLDLLLSPLQRRDLIPVFSLALLHKNIPAVRGRDRQGINSQFAETSPLFNIVCEGDAVSTDLNKHSTLHLILILIVRSNPVSPFSLNFSLSSLT